MGFFDFLSPEAIERSVKAKVNTSDEEKVLKTPKDFLVAGLKSASGTNVALVQPHNIFYKVVGFQGVVDGLGCSTIVANTAIALAHIGLNVCVLDTSMLAPSQDYLLKTNRASQESNTVGDWFDLPVSSKSCVLTSSINKRIGVLSFSNRGILDLVSSSDDEDLVTYAVNEVSSRYDIILIDICREPSQIVLGALHNAHTVVQVWGNAPHQLRNVEGSIRDNVALSCPIGKMRCVVTSNTVDDVKTDWDVLIKQYGFQHIAHVGMSVDIARVNVIGKTLFNYPSNSEDIQEFNDCIHDIVGHLLGIENTKVDEKGTITTEDIMEGRVSGTLMNKVVNSKDKAEVVISSPDNINELPTFSDDLGDTPADNDSNDECAVSSEE